MIYSYTAIVGTIHSPCDIWNLIYINFYVKRSDQFECNPVETFSFTIWFFIPDWNRELSFEDDNIFVWNVDDNYSLMGWFFILYWNT